MAAHAVSGKLYIGAITSASGSSGTEIDNIEGRQIEFSIPREVAYFRTGRAPDQITGFSRGASALPLLIVRARNVDANTINLMFQDVAASGGVQPDGGSITSMNAAAATTAIIVRPNVASQRTLYMPNASIAPDQVTSVLYSVSDHFLVGQDVAFVPTRAASSTEPAWAYDAAASVNALYAGLS